MRTLRRPSYAIRVEMTPLIDVVFLLLTFFIYSLVMTVRAQIMPVTLTPVSESTTTIGPRTIDAITISRDGKYYFNQAVIEASQLPARLAQYAAQTDRRQLFIAMEAQGDTDRGPLLISLIEQLRMAGISDFAIVGQPLPGNKAGSSHPLAPLPEHKGPDTPAQGSSPESAVPGSTTQADQDGT